MNSGGDSITKKLDALYEFDREPVSTNKLQGAGNFIGVYAGEHVAGARASQKNTLAVQPESTVHKAEITESAPR